MVDNTKEIIWMASGKVVVKNRSSSTVSLCVQAVVSFQPSQQMVAQLLPASDQLLVCWGNSHYVALQAGVVSVSWQQQR